MFWERVEEDLTALDRTLQPHAKRLSEEYRAKTRATLTQEAVSAYLATRLPATYAALQAVFERVRDCYPEKISSLLDLGAGPGTGIAAAYAEWPIERGIAMEASPHFVERGSRYTEGFRGVSWVLSDLLKWEFFPTVDLALFSYSLGELEGWRGVMERVWQACHLLVVVEPGTPAGFCRIREVREFLIERGGLLIAPCPHSARCPMGAGDWCHFYARLPRTRLHRQLKEGSRGFEDEKFSYVAVSKAAGAPCDARIIRHPQVHSGHISLTLCGKEGIFEQTISKREGERFRQARKREWGDALLSS